MQHVITNRSLYQLRIPKEYEGITLTRILSLPLSLYCSSTLLVSDEDQFWGDLSINKVPRWLLGEKLAKLQESNKIGGVGHFHQ
jgi:hypothetical protein